MSKSKNREFNNDLVDAMIADINMALVGVAQKYNLEFKLTSKIMFKGNEADIPLNAVLLEKSEPVTARVAAMIAALPSAQPKHFPDLSLTSTYINGDHSYKIIGFNNKAREHKLLLQNVNSGELFRFSIEQVSEFKAVKAKRVKK